MERDDVSLIVQTAKAGEWLGMKLIYLEAGSGALFPVPQHTISAVKKTIHVPLIVGGGIDSAEKAGQAVHAGADVVVIGNILEKKPRLLKEIARAIHHASSKVMTIQ